MAKKISRSMQKKYRRRRIGLLVVCFALVAGVTVFLIGAVGWFFAGDNNGEDGLSSNPVDGQLDPETVNGAGELASEPEPEPEPEPAVVIGEGDEWMLILASADNPLPDGYAPPELEIITENYQVDSRIASALRRMIADAKQEGITLLICSAYRDQDYQQVLFENKVAEYRPYRNTEEEAIAAAVQIVLYPGTSEHQTGLAVDIVTPEYQTLDDGYADTPAAKWLADNAWKYGFVLRYPQDKQEITNIIFEPWHYRYVGEEHAQTIYEKGYCLEEYLYYELGRPLTLNGVSIAEYPEGEDQEAAGEGEEVPQE